MTHLNTSHHLDIIQLRRQTVDDFILIINTKQFIYLLIKIVFFFFFPFFYFSISRFNFSNINGMFPLFISNEYKKEKIITHTQYVCTRIMENNNKLQVNATKKNSLHDVIIYIERM